MKVEVFITGLRGDCWTAGHDFSGREMERDGGGGRVQI